MSSPINYFTADNLLKFQNARASEQRVADVIQLSNESLSLDDNLKLAKSNGVKYVLVGIPEDIGPRGNLGNGGADSGWQIFLSNCLHRQHNQYFDWTQVLLLGEVELADIREQASNADLDKLRDLCEHIDERVSAVLAKVFAAELEPIVIGGGHNNAYPVIKALSETSKQKVRCSNLDPHADMRALEGRHSGNPFHYAFSQGFIEYYHVLGLHEQKNNQNTLDNLKQTNSDGSQFGHSTTYQQLFIERSVEFEHAIESIKIDLVKADKPIGLELDVDSIKYTPASAYSPCGFTIEQAARYIYAVAQLDNVAYCHLSEGAVNGMQEKDSLNLGHTLSELVYSYLISRSRR